MLLVCIILFGYNYFDLKIEHFDNIFVISVQAKRLDGKSISEMTYFLS